MKAFRERNPLVIGTAGIAVLASAAVVALNAKNLTVFGAGPSYAAAFSEASGLRTGEDVTIAGVAVGKVTGVNLEGDHVRVDFRTNKGVHFGNTSQAAIKLETVLGTHEVAISPSGSNAMAPGTEIPVAHTSTPYDIVPAISELTKKTDQINVQQLAQSFTTLSSAFKNTPPQVKASLSGLSRLSTAVASQQENLRELLGHSSDVTAVLASRSGEINQIIDDGDLVLKEVEQRRAVIHQLLINTVVLSQQVEGLIQDNKTTLQPLLTHLGNVESLLLRNQQNLDKSLSLLGPVYTELADTEGNGRWFDNWEQNLTPFPPSGMPSMGNNAALGLLNQLATNGTATSGGSGSAGSSGSSGSSSPGGGSPGNPILRNPAGG
jgi:phospholipid/cholesterol/gamma-HCH transport system substrate-binding protein